MRLPAKAKQTQAFLLAVLLGSPTLDAYDAEEIQTWFLEDGTELLLVEDHRAPLVNIRITFNVIGLMPWSVENDAQAAFTCQMFAPDRRIQRQIEETGVFLSSGMGSARAFISGSSLEVDFPKLIALIREVLENRNCDRKELRKWQRDRVISWRSTTTNPRTILSQEAIKLLFPFDDDPRNALYDRPRSFSFSSERLAKVRDEVLMTPMRNIAVSGSINKQKINELVNGLLPISKDTSQFRDPHHLPQSFAESNTRTIELANLTQVYMALIRDSLPISHGDYPSYLLVNQILGGTFNSRLYQKLRHETGDTYSATLSSIFSTPTRPGMLRLQTYTRVDNATETERRLRSVLEEVHRSGVTQEEVQKALAYLNGTLVFSKETPSQIVARAANYRLVDLPTNFWEMVLERASKIPIDEINLFARAYYDPAKFALVKVVPE